MAVILVTGGLGFIGRGVVSSLQNLGHDVRIIDSLEPRVHGGTGEGKHVCDIAYSDLADVEIVVHLAAQVGVADSMTEPLRYIRQNTYETAILLEQMAQAQLNRQNFRRFVVASSMSVYGDPFTEKPVKETHSINPASVYGLTKFDQERLCRIWGDLHAVPTVALRFFNVYGPGQCLTNPYTGVLANFAQALTHNQQPTVFEDGQQTRDFVYVDDVVHAVVLSATEAQRGGTYNVCTGKATTIADAAIKLARGLGRNISPDITHSARPGDIRHCIGDPAAFWKVFGFIPAIGFGEGIMRYASALRD